MKKQMHALVINKVKRLMKFLVMPFPTILLTSKMVELDSGSQCIVEDIMLMHCTCYRLLKIEISANRKLLLPRAISPCKPVEQS
jgi:hypothetical protein